MENDFLQKVDLTLLQKDTKMSLAQIAELVEINPKAVYKWAYAKDDGGSRPTYNAIRLLKEKGASDKALFGLDTVVDSPGVDDAEFAEKVKGVLRALIK